MRLLFASVALLALAACGGGGGSTGGTTPTPPPAPVPPPPPPPPPPVATARVIVTASGPAFFNFYPDETFTFDNTTPGGYGTRNGEYFPNFGQGFGGAAYNVGGGDLSGRAKTAQMIDPNTSTYLRFSVPASAKIVSPLTALLVGGADQTKLKTQLGITGSIFGLQSLDPDLFTFDAIAESQSANAARQLDAARLLAGNARALALGALVLDNGSPVPIFDFRPLATALASGPNRFLFNQNAEMTTIVAALPNYASLRPDVQSAIAHLLNAYAAAINDRIVDADGASTSVMGVIGWLAPRIRELRAANSASAASAALAVNAQQIRDEISRYRERIPITTTGFFFPGPDHYETTVNTPLQLRSGAAMGQLLGYPLENDLNANGATGAIGFFGSSGTTITAVSVPAINATQISAVLGVSGTIDITPASGFRGLTYVDYTVRFGGGEIQTGRMYVRVR